RVQIPRYAEQFSVSLEQSESFNIEVGLDEEENTPPVVIPPGGTDIGVIDGPDTSHHGHIPPASKEERSKTDSSGISWSKIWPWLLIAALILLLIFLARSCDTSNTAKSIDETPVISSTTTEDGLNGTLDNSSGNITTPPASSGIESNDPASSQVAGVDSLEEENISDEKEDAAGLRKEKPSASSTVGTAFGFTPGSMLGKMEAFLSGTATGESPIYTMDEARFPFNSPKLNKEAEKELDQLTELLSAYPSVKLDIFGHLDMNEDDYYSGPFADEFITLSAIRARCIYRKLIKRGIEKDRLDFKGFAKDRPIDKEVNPINRRLELVLRK
ncbi:MAG: OmpA family protein, partial [Bacteroidota bacterium]